MPQHHTARDAVDGVFDTRLAVVRDAFAAGFAAPVGERETGTAPCAMLDGRVVVNRRFLTAQGGLNVAVPPRSLITGVDPALGLGSTKRSRHTNRAFGVVLVRPATRP